MGASSSKEAQEKAAKARRKVAKYEWQVQEKRREEEARSRNETYARRKWSPPGTYDVRPNTVVSDSRQQQRGYEFEAPNPDKHEEEESTNARRQTSRPGIKIMELRPNEVDPEGDSYQSRRTVARQRESGNISPKVHEVLSKREELESQRADIDDQIRKMEQQERRSREKFRKAAEREKQLRLAEEAEIESLETMKRRRAELLHREKELSELASARDQVMHQEREDWEKQFNQRKLALTEDQEKVRRARDVEQSVKGEEAGLEAQARRLKDLADANEKSMQDIAAKQQELQRRRMELDQQRHKLKQRSAEHQKQLAAARQREEAVLRDVRGLEASLQTKEQRLKEETDRQWKSRQSELEGPKRELESVRAEKNKLGEQEKAIGERKADIQKQLKQELDELERRKKDIQNALIEQQKLIEKKPVPTSKDVVREHEVVQESEDRDRSVTSQFSTQNEQQRNMQQSASVFGPEVACAAAAQSASAPSSETKQQQQQQQQQQQKTVKTWGQQPQSQHEGPSREAPRREERPGTAGEVMKPVATVEKQYGGFEGFHQQQRHTSSSDRFPQQPTAGFTDLHARRQLD